MELVNYAFLIGLGMLIGGAVVYGLYIANKDAAQ